MVKVRNNKFNKVINCSFLSLIPGSVVVCYSSHLLLPMQTSTNALYVNFLDITFFTNTSEAPILSVTIYTTSACTTHTYSFSNYYAFGINYIVRAKVTQSKEPSKYHPINQLKQLFTGKLPFFPAVVRTKENGLLLP